MRIAIVNDSAMAVESLRRVLISVAEYDIAWLANDGAEAVWRCSADVPDLILMDLIMPVMDGVEATCKIMKDSPCAILVVTATVEGNASKVFQAMGHGALDAVNTPVLGMTGDAPGKDDLLYKIANIGKLIRPKKGAVSASVVREKPRFYRVVGRKLVAIGASSGGPKALSVILRDIPADFSVPIVVVQHVDAKFSKELALWLNQQCALDVRLAEVGDELQAGLVLIAGTNNHLVLGLGNQLEYTADPKTLPYRPSVDVFFNSLVQHWNGDVLALLLTGMGRDGAEGMLNLRNKGMYTIAQDESSCAVYGMPKAAVQLGAASKILSISEMAPILIKYAKKNNFCGLIEGGEKPV